MFLTTYQLEARDLMTRPEDQNQFCFQFQINKSFFQGSSLMLTEVKNNYKSILKYFDFNESISSVDYKKQKLVEMAIKKKPRPSKRIKYGMSVNGEGIWKNIPNSQSFNLVEPGIPTTALRIPGFHPSIPGFIFLDFDLKL
jgi:hypothetical protein